MMAPENFTVDSLAERVSKNLHGREWVKGEPARAAAVSIVLFDVGEIGHYCLIKRAARGRNAGQWALPGGKVEPQELPVDAALREAHEEVALPSSGSTVLGRLDDVATATGFVIAPFVVLAPRGWRPIAADVEVHGAFEFSVPDLMRPTAERWVDLDGGLPLLQMHIREGTRVHAPTGAILWQFSQTALAGKEVSIAGIRQPDFTHR